MKLLKAMGVATAVTLTLCAEASAQEPLRFEFTPVIGAQRFTATLPPRFMLSETYVQNAEFSNAPTAGAHIGVRIAGRYGIEVNALVAPTSMTAWIGSEGTKEIDVGMLMVGGSASIALPEAIGDLETFMIAGAGMKLYSFDDPALDARTSFMMNLGMAAHYPLSPRFGAYAEVRDYVSNFETDMFNLNAVTQHDVVFAAGLRYSVARRGMVLTRR
jgi:hypothetical protein